MTQISDRAMAGPPPDKWPAVSTRVRALLIAGGVVLAVLVFGSTLGDGYIDWLWFGEVGYPPGLGHGGAHPGRIFVVVSSLVGGTILLAMLLAYRHRPIACLRARTTQSPATAPGAAATVLGLAIAVGSACCAVWSRGDWSTVQLFLNGGRSARGSRVRSRHRLLRLRSAVLPIILNWLFVAVFLAFFASLVTHYIFGGLRLAGPTVLTRPARIQLAVLAGTFVAAQGGRVLVRPVLAAVERPQGTHVHRCRLHRHQRGAAGQADPAGDRGHLRGRVLRRDRRCGTCGFPRWPRHCWCSRRSWSAQSGRC